MPAIRNSLILGLFGFGVVALSSSVALSDEPKPEGGERKPATRCEFAGKSYSPGAQVCVAYRRFQVCQPNGSWGEWVATEAAICPGPPK